LVLEYVKINDPDIPSDKKLPLEKFLTMLYSGVYKGFNLIFGNVLDQAYNGKRTNGNLRIYTD
jgi:uncharacterized protein with NRDE domain